MSITNEEELRKGRRNYDQERDKSKFADYIQLHTINGKVITRVDEKKILQEGLTQFGLNLREAQGILLSVASEREIALVSHIEHHIEIYLQQVAKGSKVARSDFNKAVFLYRKLTKESISDVNIRSRIKQMIEQQGWTGRRRILMLGSKRWFKKI